MYTLHHVVNVLSGVFFVKLFPNTSIGLNYKYWWYSSKHIFFSFIGRYDPFCEAFPLSTVEGFLCKRTKWRHDWLHKECAKSHQTSRHERTCCCPLQVWNSSLWSLSKDLEKFNIYLVLIRKYLFKGNNVLAPLLQDMLSL